MQKLSRRVQEGNINFQEKEKGDSRTYFSMHSAATSNARAVLSLILPSLQLRNSCGG